METSEFKTPGFDLKDSGNRRVFGSGAQRDRPEGKGRYDLLSPIAIQRLAVIYEKGAAKYSPRNWEKGMPISQFVDSALRHTFQLSAGMTDEDHAGQAMWNMASYIHTKHFIDKGLLPASLDDRPMHQQAESMEAYKHALELLEEVWKDIKNAREKTDGSVPTV